MSESRRRWAIGALATSVLLALLWMPVTASAYCERPHHIDTAYERDLRGIVCHYGGESEETWTVPAQITKPRFELIGAEGPAGEIGGFVKATLPLKAGDEITLRVGGDGAASSISRGGEVLLRAGGGDGAEPNFVSPQAEAVQSQAPGGTGPWVGDGFIEVRWYDARAPFDLAEPLPPNPVDFPGTAFETFSHTGARQKWTVPEGINRAAFDLYGGAGTSGQPYGHVVTAFPVTPGRSYEIFVGGPGGDTILGGVLALAAGGDTERLNYLPLGGGLFDAEFWEGGGPGSQAGEGKALVHYWWEPEPGPPAPDPPQSPAQGQSSAPPPAETAELCVVPRLTSRTPRAARRQLASGGCDFGKVIRRQARSRMRGRVIRQRPSPGKVIPADRAVHLIVGR
jgi:hypothetical protein